MRIFYKGLVVAALFLTTPVLAQESNGITPGPDLFYDVFSTEPQDTSVSAETAPPPVMDMAISPVSNAEVPQVVIPEIAAISSEKNDIVPLNTSLPEGAVLATAPKTTETPSTAEKDATVFDKMMETLFGDSSLPEPKGSLEADSKIPAPNLDTNMTSPALGEMTAAPPRVVVAAPPSTLPTVGAPPPGAVIVGGVPGVATVVPPTQPVPVYSPAPVQEVRRKNVNNFDIAGVRLGMSPVEITRELLVRGFNLVHKDTTTPSIFEWNAEQKCMDEGVFIFEKKKECIKEYSKRSNLHHIRYLEFKKPERKETIGVYFTSNFSGNKAYSIFFKSEGDNSLGDTPASQYLREKRSQDFYDMMTKRYGKPDDVAQMLWGSGGGAYMRAFVQGGAEDFFVIMENRNMLTSDKSADQKELLKMRPIYSFNF